MTPQTKELLQALLDGKELEVEILEGWKPTSDLNALLSIASMHNVRIKPETIMIGGVEVPKPFDGDSGDLDTYFIPNLSRPNIPFLFRFVNTEDDLYRLENKIIHENREAATKHAKALIKISGGLKDEL